MGIKVRIKNARALKGKIIEKEISARDLISGGTLGVRRVDFIDDRR